MIESKKTTSMTLIENMVEAKNRVRQAEKQMESSARELDESKVAVTDLESEINADESLCSILMSTGVIISDGVVMYQDEEGYVKTKPFTKTPFIWELDK